MRSKFSLSPRSVNGGKDLWKRWVLSLEWKVEAEIGDESEDGDCDEVICAGEANQEHSEENEGWRNEEGSWFHRWGDAYWQQWQVICNEEDTDGHEKKLMVECSIIRSQ